MRTRSLLLGAAVGAVLLLTGCTGEAAPTSSASSVSASASVPVAPSSAPSPSGTPTTSAEARYVSAVQQLDTALASVDPAILIALGHDVCRSLGDGRTVAEISDSFGRLKGVSNLSGAEAAVIIGSAVPTLCPRYRDRLTAS